MIIIQRLIRGYFQQWLAQEGASGCKMEQQPYHVEYNDDNDNNDNNNDI